MIHLTSKTIQAATNEHLSSVQEAILSEHGFEAQARRASSRWDSKTSSNAAREAFRDIKETLIRMCVGVEICVYCENNEATDIEHIFPKKLYPEKAFSWDNYVLACGKCNTHYKSDRFKIFNPTNSTIEVDVTPPRGMYLQPATDDALFINQRVEDPMEYLELDLVNQQFIFTERHTEGSREYYKAKYTKELLGLNTRASLIAQRKNATKYFRDRLEKYVKTKGATNFDELVAAINDDFGGVDRAKNFELEKTAILESIKNDILTYSHLTVWKELVRQRNNLPKINAFLNQAPEALGWFA
jgi:uncharacterized protein (TIGR02646 family)